MSAHSQEPARILLKARPTVEQLADRIAYPRPDGMELYLDVADIAADDWLPTLTARIAALSLPSDFVWVVEGPLRSLDGTFFDVGRPSAANREVLDRLIGFGRAIEAKGAVIHAIALAEQPADLTEESRARKLEDSLPLLRHYADRCHAAGIVPTIENVPPVTKMRESRLMHSVIGMEADDLLWLAERIEGLRVTLDVSHAGLALNAANADPEQADEELRDVCRYLASRRVVATLDEYIARLEPLLFETHISDAEGLLGEGLPYGAGELDLDGAIRRLDGRVRYFVTETIEPNPNHAVHMRDVQERLARLLGRDRATASGGAAR